MKTRSAKNKGLRLQNLVKDAFRQIGQKYGLVDEDITSAIMGQSGTDIIFSPAAKQVFQFAIECKNTETLNLNNALQQAENNTKEGQIPLLIFKKNRSKVYAIIELENLLNILYKNQE